MVTSTTIYAVRHGESTWNKERRLQGRAIEPPLTELGIEQAEMAAQFFKDLSIQAVVSSPMERARQTARIIAKHLNIEQDLRIVEGLAECDVGRFSGMLYTQVHKERRENEGAYFQEVEADADIALRVEKAFREIAQLFPDRTVLAVTHCGSIKSIVRRLDKERVCDPKNLEGNIFYCQNLNEQVTIGNTILPGHHTQTVIDHGKAE